MKVSDLSVSDQPLYRLNQHGGNYLTNVELLALILGSDYSIAIAQQLFFKFKSFKEILTASPQELQQVKGIGKVQAGKILAVFEIARRLVEHPQPSVKKNAVTSPDELFHQIKSKLTCYHKEHFFVCSLDTRNNLIAIDQVSIGTLTASLVHPREAFEICIRRHAAHAIIAHNHPSGELDPSEDDLKITKRLVNAGSIMGIDILDHIIVTQHGYLSFKEKCLI